MGIIVVTLASAIADHRIAPNSSKHAFARLATQGVAAISLSFQTIDRP